MTLDPALAARALENLARQADELDGKRRILAIALREIEDIANDYLDLGREDLSRIIHICQTGGVKTAMADE